MKKRAFLFMVCLYLMLTANAQEFPVQMILQKATAEYNIGRFGQVFVLLEDQVVHWSVTERCQGYRLLALSYLANDQMEKCCDAIREMLKAEPYYTPALQDPLRFVRLVKELQSDEMTLVTASQQAESLEEAPVPVTVITREMLEDIGARTLKDALLAYVPGMNHVESANEVNVAMRGVFSSGQQKMLLMLNGHRLNSRSTHGANPDYSISLDKVRQIEVLRGPASSLYGNVALTAVVNVITCDGNQAAGLKVAMGAGNWGQRRFDLVFGHRYADAEFVVWGSGYKSDGQVVHIPYKPAVTDHFTPGRKGGQAIIGGYKDLPSYEVGMTCSRRGFTFLMNQCYSKLIDPFAAVGKRQGALYTYDKYRKIDGMGIGYGVTNRQLELSWNGSAGKWKLNGNIGLDWVTHHQMAVVGDSIAGYKLNGEYTYSTLQLMKWQEYTLGGTLKMACDYRAGKLGKGNLLAGVQAEHLHVYSADCMLWRDFDIFMIQLDMLDTGCEDSYSLFMQMKHYLPGHWIVNGGVRADCKVRADRKRIFAVSPRFALIWLPNESWYLKGSVSRAFVDAPYFLRYNHLPTFKADSLLRPEYLTSVQFSYGWHINRGWSYEGNCFYNLLTDMVFRDKTVLDDSDPYKNAGMTRIAGWENTLRYTGKCWRMQWNVSALAALNRMENVCGKGRIYHIPPLTVVGVGAVRILKKEKSEWWLQADGKFMMKQLSPIKNIYFGQEVQPDINTDGYGVVNVPGYTLPDCWLMNAGVTGQWKKLTFSLHVYNVFDRTYSQGGSTLFPYRQQGRNIMVKLGVRVNGRNQE